MKCPKCSSTKIVTDREMDPPHTCTDCWRAFEDKDIPADTETAETSDDTEVQIGEVIGWRAWYIIETPEGVRLQSLGTGGVGNGHHIWEPGSVEVASCEVRDNHYSPASAEAAMFGTAGVPWEIQVPVEGCSCGFYSALTREHLIELNSYHLYDLNRGQAKCIGEVAMSGKVIPGSQGWKAQEMWPHKLYVPYEFWRYVKPLEAAYKVPVELSRTLEKEVNVRR